MLISDYLKSLGSTSQEVAENLRTQGIKGRKSTTQNPIVKGIYEYCPDVWSGLQTKCGKPMSNHNWYFYATFGDDQICDPQLPQPVIDFLGEFWNGAWWDLLVEDSTEQDLLEEDDD